MIVKQIYNIENKSQLLINIPENFRKSKKVVVLIDDSVETRLDKLLLMKKASMDSGFLSDISTISNDFKNIDPENL